MEFFKQVVFSIVVMVLGSIVFIEGWDIDCRFYSIMGTCGFISGIANIVSLFDN